jgi:hypothetical protein
VAVGKNIFLSNSNVFAFGRLPRSLIIYANFITHQLAFWSATNI